MRFEHAAAYAIGVVLPALEVMRRRTDFTNIPNYLDDFIAGGFLLIAALAMSRRSIFGPALLVAAWGVLSGGLYGSFFAQLNNPASTDISGLGNLAVVAVKGALFALAIVALVRSIRADVSSRGRA